MLGFPRENYKMQKEIVSTKPVQSSIYINAIEQ